MQHGDVIYAVCRKNAKSFSLHQQLGYCVKRCGDRGFIESMVLTETNVKDKCEYLSDNYLDSIVIASYICNPLRKRRIVLRKANTKF
jgi:hypothetical protein